MFVVCCVLISVVSSSLAGGAMFSEYSSVHLHRSEVGQDHQLALAGETEIMTMKCNRLTLFISLLYLHVVTGCVCPPVDPHVVPVPCCPLLHHLVSPLSSLY